MGIHDRATDLLAGKRALFIPIQLSLSECSHVTQKLLAYLEELQPKATDLRISISAS